MLLLTRRPGEQIRVTVGDVVISVILTAIHGQQAKIGIDAPAKVIIDREEVALRKDHEVRP